MKKLIPETPADWEKWLMQVSYDVELDMHIEKFSYLSSLMLGSCFI